MNMDFIGLVDSKLNIEEIVDSVKSPKCGAVSVFMGTTRDNCDGLKVVRLVYEAYETMARKAMKKVCNEVRKKWPDIVHIAIYHRTGDVPVTEASVVIAVSSPHRQDSLSAVQFAIDSLKASVPVWKKEEYEDSDVEAKWKENKECAWTSST